MPTRITVNATEPAGTGPARAAFIFSLLVLALATGCQTGPQPVPGVFEETEPDAAFALPEGTVYEIDAAASELRILIGSAGTLARFGHDHVAGGDALEGQIVIADPFHASGLDALIRVDRLELDRRAWLDDEGLETDLSQDEIDRTRDNMLSADGLDADNHPNIRFRSVAVSGPRWQPDITMHVTLRDQTRETVVPVALAFDDDRLVATGRVVLRHTEFGLEPFSAMGGALEVADEVVFRFRIVARRQAG